MWRIAVFLMVLIAGIVSCSSSKTDNEATTDSDTTNATVNITEPGNGSLVPGRPYVTGTVADLDMEVWVIVHPMEVSDYWVQPSVSVKEDGTWKVKIYIGRPGSIDVGKQFEIMAVADPKFSLSEGKVLSGWPDARCKSQVIEVTRE